MNRIAIKVERVSSDKARLTMGAPQPTFPGDSGEATATDAASDQKETDWPGQARSNPVPSQTRGLFMYNSIHEHKQLEVALLELALSERRSLSAEMGTRRLVDKLRSDPAWLKGITFELHVNADEGSCEPLTRIRIPKLPVALSRRVISREKVSLAPPIFIGASERENQCSNKENTLRVRRISTGAFQGRLSLFRHSSSNTKEAAGEDACRRKKMLKRRDTCPMVKLDSDTPKLNSSVDHFPLSTYRVSVHSRPARRPSTSMV